MSTQDTFELLRGARRNVNGLLAPTILLERNAIANPTFAFDGLNDSIVDAEQRTNRCATDHKVDMLRGRNMSRVKVLQRLLDRAVRRRGSNNI